MKTRLTSPLPPQVGPMRFDLVRISGACISKLLTCHFQRKNNIYIFFILVLFEFETIEIWFECRSSTTQEEEGRPQLKFTLSRDTLFLYFLKWFEFDGKSLRLNWIELNWIASMFFWVTRWQEQERIQKMQVARQRARSQRPKNVSDLSLPSPQGGRFFFLRASLRVGGTNSFLPPPHTHTTTTTLPSPLTPPPFSQVGVWVWGGGKGYFPPQTQTHREHRLACGGQRRWSFCSGTCGTIQTLTRLRRTAYPLTPLWRPCDPSPPWLVGVGDVKMKVPVTVKIAYTRVLYIAHVCNGGPATRDTDIKETRAVHSKARRSARRCSTRGRLTLMPCDSMNVGEDVFFFLIHRSCGFSGGSLRSPLRQALDFASHGNFFERSLPGAYSRCFEQSLRASAASTATEGSSKTTSALAQNIGNHGCSHDIPNPKLDKGPTLHWRGAPARAGRASQGSLSYGRYVGLSLASCAECPEDHSAEQ